MKMLLTLAFFLTTLTGCADTTVSLVTIRLSGAETNSATTLNGRLVTDVQLQRLMTKLGELSHDQVILVGLDRHVPAYRLVSVLKTLTDAGLKNVCLCPNGTSQLPAQSIRLLPKTNEFFQVEIKEAPELEIIEKPEVKGGRTSGGTIRR